MKEAKKEWFYAQLGHQRGPVDEATIREMIVNQELHLNDAKVWKEGMSEWLAVSEVKDFKGSVKALKPKAESAAEKQNLKEVEAKEKDEYTRGLSRGAFNLFFYFGWGVVFFGTMIILKEIQVAGFLEPRKVDESLWIKYIPYGVLGLVTLSVVAMRMRNAGYAGGWALAVVIPFVNFWVILTSLCAPKNFKIRRRIGFAGGVCFLVFLGFVGGGYYLSTRGVQLGPVGVTKFVMEKYEDLTHLQIRYSAAVQDRAEMEAKREADRVEREQHEGEPRKPSKRDQEMRDGSQ